MKIIFLIMIGVSLSFASEILNDSKTGLIWQDNSAAKETKMTWQDAMSYCSELSLGGYSDWRLPNIKELQSIVDISRYKPAIKKGFKYVNTSDYYWSSSVYVSDTKYAWIVYFKFGDTKYYNKTDKYYVRCVRGGSK
jgi:hypothetical protein